MPQHPDLLETLRQDYVATARAKGLSPTVAMQIDGLLGTATGTFQVDEHGSKRLIQVADTFNFDHKDRGSFLVNVATDATRLLAEAICSNPNGFAIVGGL